MMEEKLSIEDLYSLTSVCRALYCMRRTIGPTQPAVCRSSDSLLSLQHALPRIQSLTINGDFEALWGIDAGLHWDTIQTLVLEPKPFHSPDDDLRIGLWHDVWRIYIYIDVCMFVVAGSDETKKDGRGAFSIYEVVKRLCIFKQTFFFKRSFP